jgi:hypothetical protein
MFISLDTQYMEKLGSIIRMNDMNYINDWGASKVYIYIQYIY